MANYINIFDKEGEILGSLGISLSCWAVSRTWIIKKYNPEFRDMDIENINEQLEIVYENCKPYEEVVMMLFANNIAIFTEEDVKLFDQAIENYPEGIIERPKQTLQVFRDFLDKHKYLKIEYSHTTSAMTLSK